MPCLEVHFGTLFRGRFGLKMSPLQIAAISALLLACVYLSLGAHIPARREASTMTAPTETEVLYNVTKRTGTEAGQAKFQTDQYFKKVSKNDDTATCSARLVNSTVHKCLKSVPKCTSKQGMINVSINLQYLLHMYSHVLGLVYQNITAETDWLDLLEMIYYRLFIWAQRYLQAHNLPSGHEIVNFTCSEEPRLEYTQTVEVVLCHLREMAVSALDIIKEDIGEKNITLYDYKFCHSAELIGC